MEPDENPYTPPRDEASSQRSRESGRRGPEPRESIEVELEITSADHEVYVEHGLRSAATRRFFRRQQLATFVAAMVGIVALAFVFHLLSDDASIPAALAPACLVAVAAVLLLPYAWRDRLRSRYMKSVTGPAAWRVLGSRRVRCSPGGFAWSASWSDVRVGWRAVDRISSDDHAAYIHASAPNAYIVPRRAFANDAEFEAFVALSRRYQARAEEA